MPLWDRACGFQELRHVLREGRAEIGIRAAADGLQFAEAVAGAGRRLELLAGVVPNLTRVSLLLIQDRFRLARRHIGDQEWLALARQPTGNAILEPIDPTGGATIGSVLRSGAPVCVEQFVVVIPQVDLGKIVWDERTDRCQN